MKKRVVVIGLDGVPWHVLQILMDRDVMPNLKSAVNNGAKAALRSTIPPYTSASWTSITTGVNPGKHGIFDFMRFRDRGYNTRIVNGLDIMYPRLPEMLMWHGLRSVVVNLPHSYPFVRSSKRIIVTDWLTPNLIVYPDSVKHLASSYTHSANWDLDKKIRLPELENRIRAVTNLFGHTEWDLFFVVFSEPDWIMHMAYDAIFNYHKDITSKIYESFNKLDRFIGYVMSKLAAKDLLIVLSDHGFAAYDKLVHVNTILLQTALANHVKVRHQEDAFGRLTLARARIANRKGPRKMPLPRWVFEIVSNGLLIKNIANKISQLAFGDSLSLALTYSIDFSSSKAFTCTSPFGIHLNSKRVFKHGIVEPEMESVVMDEVVRTLSRTRDPLTGCPLFSHVAKRDEIYWGPYVKRAPQVILIPNMEAGYTISRSQDLYPKIIQRKTHFCHSLYGVLIMHGNSVQSNIDLGIINTYDILPTVLHYLDLPVPHDTDGKILFGAFPPESDIRTKPIRLENYTEKWKVNRYVMKTSHKTKKQA